MQRSHLERDRVHEGDDRAEFHPDDGWFSGSGTPGSGAPSPEAERLDHTAGTGIEVGDRRTLDINRDLNYSAAVLG